MKRSRALLFLFSFAWPGVAFADPPAVQVSNVWSRPATGTAVVYATIRNSAAVPDRLIGATSPLANHVGLHQSVESKMPGMSMGGNMGNMPMGSMTSMKTLSAIPVPAHGATSLAPGGYHLMLDLRHDIKAGDVIPLRLHFVHAGWVSTDARVKPIS
jgi:hypothetical protein